MYRLRFQVFLVTSIASIALVIEVVRISETSVYFNETTRRYILEDCRIQKLYILIEPIFCIVCFFFHSMDRILDKG
jgi:hypothetical protein